MHPLDPDLRLASTTSVRCGSRLAENAAGQTAHTVTLRQKIASLLAVLFVLLLPLTGCDSGPETASEEELAQVRERLAQRHAEEERESQKIETEKEAAERALKEEAEAKKKKARAEAARQRRRRAGKKVPLPVELADWTREDFLSAKAQRNGRFPQAVRHVGLHDQDNEEVATMLGDLLRADPLAPAGGRGAARSKPARPADIKVLVEALVLNRTPAARKLIEEIVSGRLVTDNDTAAMQSLVEALSQHPSPENEPILFLALTTQQAPSVTSATAGASGKLNRAMGEAMRSPNVSAAFRAKLADFTCDPANRSPQREVLRTILEEATIYNVPAQMVLLENADLIDTPKGLLESYFAVYGSGLMRETLRIPEAQASSASSRSSRSAGGTAAASRCALAVVKATPDLTASVAPTLWSERLARVMQARLDRLRSLDEEGPLAALASTVPRDGTRLALARMLPRNWPDGPRGLRVAGLPETLTFEPGFLVVLKSARQAWETKHGQGNRKPRVALNRTVSKTTKRKDDLVPWTSFTNDAGRTLCARLREAARRRAALARREGGSVESPTPTIPLHQDTRLIHHYRETWSSSPADSKVAVPPAPLKLEYVHAQGTIEPASLIRHYRQLVQNAESGSKPDGIWLSRLEPSTTDGWQRSLDVLIERIGPRKKSAATTAERLSVDVLIVEIPLAANKDTSRASGLTARSHKQ